MARIKCSIPNRYRDGNSKTRDGYSYEAGFRDGWNKVEKRSGLRAPDLRAAYRDGYNAGRKAYNRGRR